MMISYPSWIKRKDGVWDARVGRWVCPKCRYALLKPPAKCGCGI